MEKKQVSLALTFDPQ